MRYIPVCVLAVLMAACGGAPTAPSSWASPTFPPAFITSSDGGGTFTTRDASTRPMDAWTNTAGTHVVFWFAPDWDRRRVEIVCYRLNRNTATWTWVGAWAKDARQPNPVHEGDFELTERQLDGPGYYKCDLTRIDTPLNQSATVTFDLGGDDGGGGHGSQQPVVGDGSGGTNPPSGGGGGGATGGGGGSTGGGGGSTGGGGGSTGGGGGSTSGGGGGSTGECKVDLPDQARPDCPPGHGGTPPGQEGR